MQAPKEFCTQERVLLPGFFLCTVILARALSQIQFLLKQSTDCPGKHETLIECLIT